MLKNISHILESMGKTLILYHLIDYTSHPNNDETISKEISEELEIVVDEKDITAITCLILNKNMHMYNTTKSQ